MGAEGSSLASPHDIKKKMSSSAAVARIRSLELAGRYPLLFAPVYGVLDPGELARWVLEDHLTVRVQPQLHKLLWPGVSRGA